MDLARIVDPTSRSQLLFLNMSDELQSMVLNADLRPPLGRLDSYDRFVSNVEAHLRTLNDAGAEHREFVNMEQRNGETAWQFYGR